METLDLNLLRVFLALWEERHVTSAAERMGVSQPAMSNMLKRLRQQIGDPLFVRSGATMKPTSRAVQLAPTVSRALNELGQALIPLRPPTLSEAKGTVRVAISDYAAFLLLPRWLPLIHHQAPDLKFVFRDLRGHDAHRALEQGMVDWVLDINLPDANTLLCTTLLSDDYVCVISGEHPLCSQRLTLKRFVALDHLLVRTLHSHKGRVDQALARLRQKRNIVATVDHFLLAPPIVASTLWVCTLERRFAEMLADSYHLSIKAPPIKLAPLKLYSIWHKREGHNPILRQLRSDLAEFCKKHFAA